MLEKIFECPYRNGLANLCIDYAGEERINEFIVKMPSVRSVIIAFYDVMVSKKELIPIEEIEKCDKEKFWKMAPRNFNLNERKDCARAMYLIQKIKE